MTFPLWHSTGILANYVTVRATVNQCTWNEPRAFSGSNASFFLCPCLVLQRQALPPFHCVLVLEKLFSCSWITKLNSKDILILIGHLFTYTDNLYFLILLVCFAANTFNRKWSTRTSDVTEPDVSLSVIHDPRIACKVCFAWSSRQLHATRMRKWIWNQPWKPKLERMLCFDRLKGNFQIAFIPTIADHLNLREWWQRQMHNSLKII